MDERELYRKLERLEQHARFLGWHIIFLSAFAFGLFLYHTFRDWGLAGAEPLAFLGAVAVFYFAWKAWTEKTGYSSGESE